MRFIDMHLHTTASDGSCTPSEVCQLAIDRNLAAIAITDHDTVDGVADAITYADNWNSTLPPIQNSDSAMRLSMSTSGGRARGSGGGGRRGDRGRAVRGHGRRRTGLLLYWCCRRCWQCWRWPQSCGRGSPDGLGHWCCRCAVR